MIHKLLYAWRNKNKKYPLKCLLIFLIIYSINKLKRFIEKHFSTRVNFFKNTTSVK